MKHYNANGTVDKWDRSAGKVIEYERIPQRNGLVILLVALPLLPIAYVIITKLF